MYDKKLKKNHMVRNLSSYIATSLKLMNGYLKALKKRTMCENDDTVESKKRKFADDDDDDESYVNPLEILFGGQHEKGVTIHNNHIYYRCPVTKSSIMLLDKLINKANENFELLQSVCKIADVTPKPIYLHISSDGGDLAYGFMGYDAVRNSKIPIYTIIEGTACSAATLMAVAGNKRYALANSMVLVHQLTGGAYGKAEELKDNYQNVELFMKKLKNIYLEQTTIKSKELDKLLVRDIFLDTQTCIKYGIVDEVFTQKIEE